MVKVATYGTFDLFHKGHYNLLKRAKALGDYLIVGVTTESYDRTRGKLNVVDSLPTRIENVRQTGFADEIIIEEDAGQKARDIKKYGIDIFTVGSDWTGYFDYLKDYCQVVYLERTKDISSTMLRQKNLSIQRIGIIGTGRIARRFVIEARNVSGVSVQCAYNPHYESAKKFAAAMEIDAFENLADFYNSCEIVYIASPHETHYAYAKDAIMNGKHVLGEKPLVLKEAEAKELFTLAKEKNLILMEAIKTAYCPCFDKLLGVACSGAIGNIRYIEACFTKLENPAHRELIDEKYGGSFTEMGSYCLLPIIKLFGTAYQNLHFDALRAKNGLDIFTQARLFYPNGYATATVGLGVKAEGRLLIAGTTGYIIVAAPWWKTDYFEIHREDPSIVERFSESYIGYGMRYELSDLISRINGDTRRDFKLTREESETLAKVMEEFLRQEKRPI